MKSRLPSVRNIWGILAGKKRATLGLMAGDSLHLGSMNRHNPIIPNLATNDGDFDHVAAVTVWKPMDVVP